MGDFDGDICSLRGIWSEEANEEADRLMNSKITALTISGANSRVVAKEAVNSCFELTKIIPGGKQVPSNLMNQYLNMQPDEFTLEVITRMLANTGTKTNGKLTSHKALLNSYDLMNVPKGYFYDDQAAIKTTIGRFLFNKYVLQGAGIIGATKYVSETLNKKGLGKLDELVGTLYLEDVIDRKQFNAYINRRDNLAYWLNGMLAHTISPKFAKPLKEIEIKKKQLYKKYEKELNSGNIDVMTKVTDDLVAYAKDLLKDDPGMDLYTSGDLNFDANYKNNSIARGAVVNSITGEYDFIGSSFMDGIEIKDIPAHANSILSAQYPASIALRSAGYMGKKLLALLQMMSIDYDTDDCGTKQLLPITINEKNKDYMLYTYIQEGNGLIMLDRSNISKYVGKRVMMRTPMTCLNDRICHKCAGELFKKLDVENAGLFSVQISAVSLNAYLKQKHNNNIEIYKFNPDTIIEEL